MKNKIGTTLLAAVLVAAGSYADSFGTGGNAFSVDFVDIGYAGNAADASGYGAVGYNYRIGQKEVTLDQFAKARAADSLISDGDEGYWNDGTRTVGTAGPASYVSAYEAMKFANWLTTGSAISGAYQFNAGGTTLLAVDRGAAVTAYGTVYVLPSEDEWYKAAYYKPVDDGSYSLYANGSDSAASLTHGTANGWNYDNSGYVNGSPNYTWETGFGGEEQNGTFDMMGNVWEWNESAYDGTLDNLAERRVFRGGSAINGRLSLRSSDRFSGNPTGGLNSLGFRVAAIPEPSSIALIGLAGGFALFVRRRFRR